MLYVIEPGGGTRWIDLPARTILEALREHNADLSRLDWQESERRADEDAIRLALRHGARSSRGLVIDGRLITEQGRAAEIRQAHRNAQRARAALEPHDRVMERLFPGWIAHGQELDARVAESSEQAAREAEEDAASELASPPDPELIEHWESLGGRLPSPL